MVLFFFGPLAWKSVQQESAAANLCVLAGGSRYSDSLDEHRPNQQQADCHRGEGRQLLMAYVAQNKCTMLMLFHAAAAFDDNNIIFFT